MEGSNSNASNGSGSTSTSHSRISGSSNSAALGAYNVRELLELERQLYQESIDRTRKRLEELQNGTLEDYLVQCIPFEAERDRELETAMVHMALNKRNAFDLLEFELKQAEDIYQERRRKMKQQLLIKANQRLQRIEKRLQSFDEQTSQQNESPIRCAISHRLKKIKKEKSKNNKINFALESDTAPYTSDGDVDWKALEKLLHESQICNQKSFNLHHLTSSIPSAQRIVNDILGEHKQLKNNMTQFARSDDNTADTTSDNAVVNISKQTISCGDPRMTFCVNDPVILFSLFSEEEFYGRISDISDVEIRLVLLCGSTIRVGIDSLRQKQCVLRPQPTSSDSVYFDNQPMTFRARTPTAMKSRKRKKTIDIRRGF